MMLVTGLAGLVVLVLPDTPLARLLGFGPPPPLLLLAIAGIVVAYVALAQIAKRWFYRQQRLAR